VTEAKMAKLEGEYRFIESIHFKDVVYAIDSKGKGLHILYGKARNKEMIIGAEDMDNLLSEIKEVTVTAWTSLRSLKSQARYL